MAQRQHHHTITFRRYKTIGVRCTGPLARIRSKALQPPIVGPPLVVSATKEEDTHWPTPPQTRRWRHGVTDESR